MFSHNLWLIKMSKLELAGEMIKELLRYLVAQWEVVCYGFILIHFTQNSGLLAGLLPVVLFTWVLIEETDTPKYFWILAYALYSAIITLIFI